MYNGNFWAAFHVHGPQQVYRAETIACALASELAREGDEVIIDNQGVVKATPMKRRGVVKDQDYRDIGYHNALTKSLTIRWTPGHKKLEQATTYNDYKDIQGNNHSDTLANMGDNLPCPWTPDNHNPMTLSLWDRSCPRLPRHGSCKCVDKNTPRMYTG